MRTLSSLRLLALLVHPPTPLMLQPPPPPLHRSPAAAPSARAFLAAAGMRALAPLAMSAPLVLRSSFHPPDAVLVYCYAQPALLLLRPPLCASLTVTSRQLVPRHQPHTAAGVSQSTGRLFADSARSLLVAAEPFVAAGPFAAVMPVVLVHGLADLGADLDLPGRATADQIPWCLPVPPTAAPVLLLAGPASLVAELHQAFGGRSAPSVPVCP